MDDRIKKLERQVADLSKRCEFLEWRVQQMIVSKLSNPRYPFWQFELEYMQSMDMYEKLNLVLAALSDRAKGAVDPDFKYAEITGLPRELLSSTDPLKPEDVIEAVKLAPGFGPNVLVLDLINALKDQGRHQALCDFFLDWHRNYLDAK